MSEQKLPLKISDLLSMTFPQNSFWIEPAILPKGGTLLFGGAAKTGKSFIMLELARALSTGTRPFSSSIFSVPGKAKVLVIEQELGERESQSRYSNLLKNTRPSAYNDYLYNLSKVPSMQLNSNEGLKYLYDAIDHVQPNVVILDPISMFHGFDENSNTEIGDLFKRLEKIKGAFTHLSLSLILSHHFKKPSVGPYKTDTLSPYNFSGSQRWFNTPDTLATFHRGKTLKDKSGWFLDSRWIPRMGKQLDDITFLIRPEDEDCQVQVHSGGGDKDGTCGPTTLGSTSSSSKLPFVVSREREKEREVD